MWDWTKSDVLVTINCHRIIAQVIVLLVRADGLLILNEVQLVVRYQASMPAAAEADEQFLNQFEFVGYESVTVASVARAQAHPASKSDGDQITWLIE